LQNVTGLGSSAPCVGPECLYSETVAVTFPPGYLELHVHTGRGLDLKLYGRNGTRVIKIPAAYVAGFVQAVAENHGTGKH